MMHDRDAWFNIARTPGIGPARFQSIWRAVEDARLDVSTLFAASAHDIARLLGVKDELARRLADRFSAPLPVPYEVPPAHCLVAGDDDYPNARLREATPPLAPVLWAVGDRSRLAHPRSIGIAGSRDASEAALDAAREIGLGASRAGFAVVSGLAAGVDTAAHEGALCGRSGTVGVLACGISRHQGSPVDGDDEPICVVSEFDPEVSWDGRNAMQRNATIAALSDLVVIVASGMQGGTWEMAQLCAKRKKSLFIVDFDPSVAPGNRMLIKSLGAEAVALGELERCWTTPLPAVGSGSAQDRLF